MKPFRVESAQAGQRLDSALAALKSKYSRSAWRNLIKSGRVELNNQLTRQPSAPVRLGDTISVELPTRAAEPPEVKVLFQNDEVVVFDKPAGMLTHAKDGLSREWTLADVAKPHVQEAGTDRPGIVHRLDRATSGVIIVAKNPAAKRWLQKQFSARKVLKTYLAIVSGPLAKPKFTIDLPLGRNPRRPATFAVNPSGKPAVTEVTVVKSTAHASLVELKPLSGRTHQLRVHLSHIGHPIIGDPLYGRPDTGQRLYLHAKELSLRLPGGQSQTFSSTPPADFLRGVKAHGLD